MAEKWVEDIGGRPHAGRAKQFMPFAALKGYYDLVRERERTVEPRRVPGEDEVMAISRTLARLTRGDMVRVTYYDVDAYTSMTGMVSQVDTAFHVLTVVKNRIAFEDIAELEIVSHDD